MNESDKKHFQSIMVGAGELYSKEITKPLLQIYFQALQSYGIDQISSAFTAHMVDTKHGTFMPKPADLVRLIDADKPKPDDKARIAWMAIRDSFSGYYPKGFKLEDKIAMAAMKSIGGRSAVGMCDNSKIGFLEKQFIDSYKTLFSLDEKDIPDSLTYKSSVVEYKKPGEHIKSIGMEQLKVLRDKLENQRGE